MQGTMYQNNNNINVYIHTSISSRQVATECLFAQIACTTVGIAGKKKRKSPMAVPSQEEREEEQSPLLLQKPEENEKNIKTGFTVDGVPIGIGNGNVVGSPHYYSSVSRSQWSSDIFSCLGRSDEFCSSDLETCLIGSVAPCVLYGTNVERLSSTPGTFPNHCFRYSSLYLLGNFLFGWNCLAPWFSYPSRTAIRRKFNLEGNCEALDRSCGCCGSIIEDDEQREQCESACDFATHFFCHSCALCQEGRELRRRLPHPGFNARSVLVMLPPTEQSMGRDG